MIALATIVASPFVGSFLCCLADRTAAGESALLGRSRCDHCGRMLSALDLVPLASWALAGGRARCCGVRLGLRLPAAEIAALALALWAVAVLPASLVPAGALLGWTLLGLALVDLACFRLPDPGTLGLTLAGLALAAAGGLGDPAAHALGALAGYAAFRAIAFGYRAWRGIEGLGRGDAKLAAAAGAWVGLAGLPSVVLVACLTGLAQALAQGLATGRLGARTALPFGPALCLGLWVVFLHGPVVPA